MYGQWLDLAVATQGENPFPVFLRIRRIARINNAAKSAIGIDNQVLALLIMSGFSASRTTRNNLFRRAFGRFRASRCPSSSFKGDSKKATHRFAVAFDRVRFRDLEKLQHQPFERTVNLCDRQRPPAHFRDKTPRMPRRSHLPKDQRPRPFSTRSSKKNRSESLSASRLSTICFCRSVSAMSPLALCIYVPQHHIQSGNKPI